MPYCPLSKLPEMWCDAGNDVFACSALSDAESPCLIEDEDETEN